MSKAPQLSWLTALIVMVFACNGGGDSRESTTSYSSFQFKTAVNTGTSSSAETDSGVGSTSQTPTSETSGDTTTGGTATGQLASTTVSGPGTTQVGAATLAQCQSASPPTAWRPVVNGGNSPADCGGGNLVSWCPTRAVIEAQFPTYQAALETGNNGNNFSTILDQQGLQIYAVSVDPSNPGSYDVHMAKISTATGAITYDTIIIPGTPTQPSQTCSTGQPITDPSQLDTANLTDGPALMINDTFPVEPVDAP